MRRVEWLFEIGLALVAVTVFGSVTYLTHAQRALDEQTQWATLENMSRQLDNAEVWLICNSYGCIVNEPMTAAV